MKRNTQIARICNETTSMCSNEMYVFTSDALIPVHTLKRPDILLPFKFFLKKKKKERFTKQLNIKISKKYKIVSTDFKKRLFTKNPNNDVLCRNHIYEDLYINVKGRPLRSNMLIFKTLKGSINKLFQLKQEIGLKENCVLNLHVHYANEMNVYKHAKKRLSEQVKCFDAFMSEDYQKSMAALLEWEKLKGNINLKTEELQNVAIEQFTLRSRLISLEYQYGIQQKYGRFLYYLSPTTWRFNNRHFARSIEIEAKGFDFIDSSEEDTFAVIFERLRNICYGVQVMPVIYFTQPQDLVEVFNFTEKQQLHYYTHINHLAPHIKTLKNGIKQLKELIRRESIALVGAITHFQSLLSFSKDKCNDLETKFMRILYGMFYQSTGAVNVLKLQFYLEFCYKKIFLENPSNVDILFLAQSIENVYLVYTQRLDSIKSKVVRHAIVKCVEEERIKSKRAIEAAKELRSFYRLEKRLLCSYGILNNDSVYKPFKKTSPKESQNKIHKYEPKILSDVEIEYLTLFTDWTVKDDPTLYLHS